MKNLNILSYLNLSGVQAELYKEIYSLGFANGRCHINPGVLYKATFKDVKAAIETLGIHI